MKLTDILSRGLKKSGFLIPFPVMMMASVSATAQSGEGEYNTASLIALGFLLVATIIALIACLYALYALKVVLGREIKKAEAAPPQEQKVSLWDRINRRVGAGEVLPVEREHEIMMEHAYDGITELNNHMPPWLKYLFYVTIAFAIVYTSVYLITDTGKSQIEEYQEELALAQKQAEERKSDGGAGVAVDETNVTLVTDQAALENAEKLFVRNCAPCHAKDAGGAVGPNLTDEYWLHGGDIKDVFKVIKYGVQEKGMIPWQGTLNPEEIQHVASYILSLQGTTPANPKEPQGEKYVREEGAASEQVISAL